MLAPWHALAQRLLPLRRMELDVFETSLRWEHATRGRAGGPEVSSLQVEAPPPFYGEHSQWKQEARFVSTVETDIFLTLLTLARRNNLQILEYRSTARGTVAQDAHGVRRFAEIEVRPKITVSSEREAAWARELLMTLGAHCLIGASLKSEPRILAEVTVSTGVGLSQADEILATRAHA